jgi:hypothetical protein
MGCLGLSKTLEVEATFDNLEIALGELGNEQRQSAFCNSIKARFETVDA